MGCLPSVETEHPPVLGVPVAAEDGAVVGCEHPLVAVGPADVPQLHVAVLKGGGEGEVVADAELDVAHALRLAWAGREGEKRWDRALGEVPKQGQTCLASNQLQRALLSPL